MRPKFKYLVVYNWYDDFNVEEEFTNIRKAMAYRDKMNKSIVDNYVHYTVEVVIFDEDYVKSNFM
ncbi:hypothetical protein VP424E501_P0209 [Vibrio phage 424E50-1]|nr:hypothetical protein VP424E501_P0209 [Vibrio phage 424E50-1]